MKKTLVCVLAVATLATSLAAGTTDASAYYRRGWGWRGGYWGPGVAAGVVGGAVMPAPSSRRVPPVMWFIPDTPSRYMGLAATGLPSRFMMAMAASLGIRANRCRSVPAMWPLRQPPDLHRPLMRSRLTSEAARSSE
jgi:hypothetical protein